MKIEKYFPAGVKSLTQEEIYDKLLDLTKELIEQKQEIKGQKKLYYISSEFLIGKLLSNNLINLGIYDEVKKYLKDNQIELAAIEEIENEPSLGNGGLGRLAACFIDSIASLGLNGDGVGLLYHFGLFEQIFANLKQTAVPNKWLTKKSWLRSTNRSYEITYKDFTVVSKMYEIDVVGYNQGYNKLNLFDIESVNEKIIEKGIEFDQTDIKKNLTLFLYPDDSTKAGELLRIYQQYFMVSNAVQLIFAEMKEKKQSLKQLNEKVVIQINDTHPTLVIPELIYQLEKEGIKFDEALALVEQTCAYTNHTILAEALEKWPIAYLEEVVPHLVIIILKLDEQIKARNLSEKVQIIDTNNVVHMASICIHFGFSTNGVAKLHTEILKETELKEFYELYPERFNNKTNGITFRRWIVHANNELTNYIQQLIGEDFSQDAMKLEKLLEFKDDLSVLHSLEAIKKKQKEKLKDYIYKHEGITIDVNSIFDVQIKRMHEYKRQQMNALYIINKYLEIKKGNYPTTPITFIFGAKAAPAYTIAQDIIHLILTLSKVIENDAIASRFLKVVFVTNYNVTYAEQIIPAADISEQISLASKEASGTGNMKLMLNGAITLGTMDGANVEIANLVGKSNIYTFGKSSEEVIKAYESGSYRASELYEQSSQIKEALNFIVSPQMMKTGDYISLTRLYHEILTKDYFMTLTDFTEYIKIKDICFKDYEDKNEWQKKSLINIAKAGYFSSDRTIESYNEDIWHLEKK